MCPFSKIAKGGKSLNPTVHCGKSLHPIVYSMWDPDHQSCDAST